MRNDLFILRAGVNKIVCGRQQIHSCSLYRLFLTYFNRILIGVSKKQHYDENGRKEVLETH